MQNSIAANANYAGIMEIPNLRRLSVSELVYRLQDIQLDLLYHPGATGINKTVYQARLTTEIRRELQRRQDMPAGPVNTNIGIIQAIKDRANIVEVLEQFTEVFTHKRQWTYRCTLHGADNTPSGVIYKDENRAHCFACNKGGDVIDIVGHFTRGDTAASISWLCKFYGIAPTVLPAPTIKQEHEKYYKALNK